MILSVLYPEEEILACRSCINAASICLCIWEPSHSMALRRVSCGPWRCCASAASRSPSWLTEHVALHRASGGRFGCLLADVDACDRVYHCKGQFLNLVPESSTRSRPSESNCTLLCGFCECCRRLYPRLRQDTLGIHMFAGCSILSATLNQTLKP